MFENLKAVVQANKAIIVKRTLVVTGIIVGLAIAAVVVAKNQESEDAEGQIAEPSIQDELDRR